MEHSTPAELRNLFSILTIQGFPTINIYNDEICQIKLMEDFHYRENRGKYKILR